MPLRPLIATISLGATAMFRHEAPALAVSDVKNGDRQHVVFPQYQIDF